MSVTGPLTAVPPSASRLWKTDTALEEAGDCFRKGWVDLTQVLPSSTRGHPGQHLRWSSACRRALCQVSLGRGDRGLAVAVPSRRIHFPTRRGCTQSLHRAGSSVLRRTTLARVPSPPLPRAGPKDQSEGTPSLPSLETLPRFCSLGRKRFQKWFISQVRGRPRAPTPSSTVKAARIF